MSGAAKRARLRAAIEQGRRSGMSDRTADQILAEAKAATRPDTHHAHETYGGVAPRPGLSIAEG